MDGVMVMFSYHGASGPELSTTLCLEVCQVAVLVGRQSDNYGGCFSLTECAPGGVIYDCLSLGAINYPLIAWSGSRDPFNSGAQSFLKWGNL